MLGHVARASLPARRARICCEALYPVPVHQVLRGIGKTLISTGLLILLFVAYQLWGTNFAEARSQDKLGDDFAAQLAEQGIGQAPATTTVSVPPNSSTVSTTTTSIDPATIPPPPPTGEAMAVIKIPRIGLEKTVIEGVKVEDLKKAPGHYPGTPMPGQAGNSGIAGHRTTYGAPFQRLDEMEQGDPILVTTLQGQFTYVVSEIRIVSPDDTVVLAPTTDNRLTLTTCHPKFSAKKRLIVIAALQGEPVPASTAPRADEPAELAGEVIPADAATDDGSTNNDDPAIGAVTPTPVAPDDPAGGASSSAAETDTLNGAGAAAADTEAATAIQEGFGENEWHWNEFPKSLRWAAVVAALWIVTWLAARLWRRPISYLAGAVPFAVALFVFYENLARVLPANF